MDLSLPIKSDLDLKTSFFRPSAMPDVTMSKCLMVQEHSTEHPLNTLFMYDYNFLSISFKNS